MRIAVVGTGYVGLVTGTCLAEIGHNVVCIDKDAGKVMRLKAGEVDIYEPGLESLVIKNSASGNLQFIDDIAAGIEAAEAVFIAVGTPPNEDGSTDLSHVLGVASSIGEALQASTVVIVKSTVPVGTCHKVKAAVNNVLEQRDESFRIDVVSNPEFLKEGAAVNDFTRPDRIIIGSDNADAIDVMREMYAPYNRRKDRMIIMDVVSAELTKYAANAMLATKISFINEVANIAEYIGADIERVREGIGSDPRIGYDFIYAGCGYGGSCFPKDVRSIVSVARDVGYDSELLSSVDNVNERQKRRLFLHVQQHFGTNLDGKVLAIWGLSFKPETNDLREAPSRVLIEELWQHGVTVQVYDPVAMSDFKAIYGERDDLIYADSKEDALQDADALVICTEWKQFKVPDYQAMKARLKQPVIIDGRNLYDTQRIEKEGFTYYGIGRGASLAKI